MFVAWCSLIAIWLPRSEFLAIGRIEDSTIIEEYKGLFIQYSYKRSDRMRQEPSMSDVIEEREREARVINALVREKNRQSYSLINHPISRRG